MASKKGNIVDAAIELISTVSKAIDGKGEKESYSAGLGGQVVNAFNDIMLFLQHNAAQLQDMQLNFTRQIGSTKTVATETMQRAVDITVTNQLDKLYGFSAQDYQQGLFNIQSNLGRQVGLGSEDAGVFAAGDTLFNDSGKTMGELSAAFLQVGSNIESVGETVSKMFNNAHKSGLSFQKISASVKAHLKEVNQYGFKNGIDGMRQMAEYAERIGMDMSQVLKASGKMNSLTGATDVAARLSVLGGNFQKLGNPLQMLNESLTDVESLQKRIGNMFSGMAKWDAQKGMISVSAVDRMRINEAASAMGLDPSEVFKSVETQARRDMIEKQIGGGLTPELKNLIANTGTINKEGRAGIIDRKGKFRDVSEIAGDTDLQSQIRDLSKTEGEDIKDISQNVRALLENAKNFYEQQANRKTMFELGGRDANNKGASVLRKTEEEWSTLVNDDNSFINDLTRLGDNIQNLATGGLSEIKKFGIDTIKAIYPEVVETFSSVAKIMSEKLGINLDNTSYSAGKEALGITSDETGVRTTGTTIEVGDLIVKEEPTKARSVVTETQTNTREVKPAKNTDIVNSEKSVQIHSDIVEIQTNTREEKQIAKTDSAPAEKQIVESHSSPMRQAAVYDDKSQARRGVVKSEKQSEVASHAVERPSMSYDENKQTDRNIVQAEKQTHTQVVNTEILSNLYNGQYTPTFVAPTNNFTISINTEQRYQLNQEERRELEKVIADVATRTYNDIMQKKQARENMYVGAY